MNCIECKYYDASFDYCNADDICYMDGYEKGRADKIDDELQNFAQWLWDSNYLVDEAFTIRLVEQYKYEQLKDQNNLTCFDCEHHFMSDCYLECNKHNRINDNKICDDFEHLKEQNNDI